MRLCLVFALLHGVGIHAFAQQTHALTLQETIDMGRRQSYRAMVAKLNFTSSYWNYRSFRAEFLPAVNLSLDLMQYNHSTVEARDASSGRIYMVDNNSLTNSFTLSVDQNIAALGGTLSLQTYLYRLDQFNYDTKTYNSQPLRLEYTQPFFAYNSLKWKKKTEPLRYDKAMRAYLEAMEDVTADVVTLFFSVLSAQSDYELSVANLSDRESLFAISERRLDLGTITKSDLLQLELSLINARMEVQNKQLALSSARFDMFNYLLLPPTTELLLIAPTDVPTLKLDEAAVLNLALSNSTFLPEQKLALLESRMTLAEAKAARGVQMKLTADVGFNRTANYLRNAYRGVENEQIVGLTLSVPIFDWGVSKGRVRMAEADLEAIKTSQQQEYEQYLQDIRTAVMSFNMQNDQCAFRLRAQEIATERYEITRRRFEAGSVSVTELNTAWQEQEKARAAYIEQLRTFWSSYYSLRKTTLYDWLKDTELTEDFDKLIKK